MNAAQIVRNCNRAAGRCLRCERTKMLALGLLAFVAPAITSAHPINFDESQDGDLLSPQEWDGARSFDLARGTNQFQGHIAYQITPYESDHDRFRGVVSPDQRLERATLWISNITGGSGFNYVLGEISIHTNGGDTFDTDGFCLVTSPGADAGCAEVSRYPLDLFGFGADRVPLPSLSSLGPGDFDFWLRGGNSLGGGRLEFDWKLDLLVTSVPEPSSLLLLGFGIAGLVVSRRRVLLGV